MAVTDEVTADIPAEHVSGAWWKEKEAAGFFSPSEEMERPSGAVWWEVEAMPCAPALPSSTRPLQSSSVMLSLVSDAGRSASCWSRKSQWALEWKPARSPRCPCPAAGAAPSPRCCPWPWFSLCWRAKAAVVQPHQGPPNSLRGEAGGHCWTGEASQGELGPCLLMALSSHSQGREGGRLQVAKCSLVSSILYLWHLLEDPWIPGDRSQGKGACGSLAWRTQQRKSCQRMCIRAVGAGRGFLHWEGFAQGPSEN